MSTRVQLRLLTIVCLGVMALNAVQWFLTLPQMPQLTHLSGVIQLMPNSDRPGDACAFQIVGVDGMFYIDNETMTTQRARRLLAGNEHVHVWVDKRDYDAVPPGADPRIQVWQLTHNDVAVLKDTDVLATMHPGGTLRIIVAITAFIIATWARYKLHIMRRNQMYDRIRRPAKPNLDGEPAKPHKSATRLMGRSAVRN